MTRRLEVCKFNGFTEKSEDTYIGATTGIAEFDNAEYRDVLKIQILGSLERLSRYTRSEMEH